MEETFGVLLISLPRIRSPLRQRPRHIWDRHGLRSILRLARSLAQQFLHQLLVRLSLIGNKSSILSRKTTVTVSLIRLATNLRRIVLFLPGIVLNRIIAMLVKLDQVKFVCEIRLVHEAGCELGRKEAE